MHRRGDFRPCEIILFRRHRIGEKPGEFVRRIEETVRRMGGVDRVDLAGFQHLGQRCAVADMLDLRLRQGMLRMILAGTALVQPGIHIDRRGPGQRKLLVEDAGQPDRAAMSQTMVPIRLPAFSDLSGCGLTMT